MPLIPNSKPWIVIENPGTECEREIAEFRTFEQAASFAAIKERNDGEKTDVMKRLLNGSLTTEF